MRGDHEDTACRGQFLAGETTYDAGLAEQGLDGGIAGGDGSCMAGGGTTATVARPSLDGCDATALADEVAGIEQQLVGVSDVLHIEQLDLGIMLGIEVLVHILQHVLDAYLLTIADAPY